MTRNDTRPFCGLYKLCSEGGGEGGSFPDERWTLVHVPFVPQLDFMPAIGPECKRLSCKLCRRLHKLWAIRSKRFAGCISSTRRGDSLQMAVTHVGMKFGISQAD